MIVILRGHIRDSFATDDLLQLIRSLGPDMDLYIHTWSVYSNGVSWREIPTNMEKVTEESIRAYFQDVPIRHIQIDNDTDLPLIGNQEGTIWGGSMPLLGWKRYWYNQHAAIEYVHQLATYSDNATVLNLRFDVLKNGNHVHYPLGQIHAFVRHYRNQTFTKNRFIRDKEWWGIDNMYIGSMFTMRILIRAFHYHLDDILKQNEGTVHAEYLVYRINEKLFPPPFRLSSIGNIGHFFHENLFYAIALTLSTLTKHTWILDTELTEWEREFTLLCAKYLDINVVYENLSGHRSGLDYNIQFHPAFVNVMAFIQSTIHREYPDTQWDPDYKILYLRQDTQYRYMTGYSGQLDPYFSQVVPTLSLPFSDQVRLFMKCSHFVTIEGAALTNIVFMNPRAKVYVISNTDNSWQLMFGTSRCVSRFERWILGTHDFNALIPYTDETRDRILAFLSEPMDKRMLAGCIF